MSLVEQVVRFRVSGSSTDIILGGSTESIAGLRSLLQNLGNGMVVKLEGVIMDLDYRPSSIVSSDGHVVPGTEQPVTKIQIPIPQIIG